MAEDCRDQTRWTRWTYARARYTLPNMFWASALLGILGLLWALSLPSSALAASAVYLGEGDNLAQRLLPPWQQFSQRAESHATTVVTQQTLNQFPQGLLLSGSRYPMTSEYGWSALRALYRFSRDCPLTIDNTSQAALPAGLDKAYRFEAALCQGQPLSTAQLRPFFDSSAATLSCRWQLCGSLSALVTGAGLAAPMATLRSEYANWLSVDDSAHPLHQALAALAPAQRDTLLSGDSWALDSAERLWLSSPVGLKRLERAQWQALAHQAGITLVARDSVAQCPLPVGHCVCSLLPRALIVVGYCGARWRCVPCGWRVYCGHGDGLRRSAALCCNY
ncbi:DUF3404 domain-containing protein [Plesiomonas shigelloides subsp. oncorhynchi]|nr:DUF3404 domain-containing protein [Plesiomonas shigelloides]